MQLRELNKRREGGLKSDLLLSVDLSNVQQTQYKQLQMHLNS